MSVMTIPFTVVPVRQSVRTISGPVTGWDGQAAVGATVLVLAKNEWSRWQVVKEVVTDANGYTASIFAGVNDRNVVVGIGRVALAEASDVLGNMQGVV